jgi:hypothetical protein
MTSGPLVGKERTYGKILVGSLLHKTSMMKRGGKKKQSVSQLHNIENNRTIRAKRENQAKI